MHRADDILILMGTGDGEHIGEARADHVSFIAHTARDNHPAIFRHRLANRLKALFLGAIQKAAGVDQHNIGTSIIGRHCITIGAQLRQDAFAIDQRLGTAKRHHAHFGRFCDSRCHNGRAHRPISQACHEALATA
jgi:hypothetical protein